MEISKCAWSKPICLCNATVNGYCRAHYTVACRELNRMSQEFITKDSGAREEFSTGMKRDTQKDKPRYDLLDRAFLKRWAELMGRGAEKYGENNWRQAATEAELRRFEASATRHLFQWLDGDRTEDHAAAVAFNLAGAEMVKEKLNVRSECDIPF